MERRVSELLCVVSKHNRATFHFFFFASETTNLPQSMPERTRAAASAVHFCCRAASRLAWPHQQEGPGLDQSHAAVHLIRENVVEKGSWRVNLDVPLPSAARDFGKRCAATGRSKLCVPQPLILAEAAPPPSFPTDWHRVK